MTKEIDRINKAIDEGFDVISPEDCPNCDNVGWYIEQDSNTGEPLQEQCEWCYTNPKSLFNYNEGQSHE